MNKKSSQHSHVQPARFPEDAFEASSSEEEAVAGQEENLSEDVVSLDEQEKAPEDPFEQLQEENNNLQDQLLRLAADFENFKRRSRLDAENMRLFASERLVRELLPVMDNLDRALQHTTTPEDPVVVGVQMVLKQLHDVLVTFGVKSFVSVGECFDPSRHEAIASESQEGIEAGQVLRELQKGYLMHEKLIRPANVIVSA